MKYAYFFRFELNKLRRGRGSPVVKKGNPSYAAVSLSDIRIPLLWRPKDHMEVKYVNTIALGFSVHFLPLNARRYIIRKVFLFLQYFFNV